MAVIAGAGPALALLPWPEAAFASLWWLLVLIVARVDIEHYLIPDRACATIACLGLAQCAFTGAPSGAAGAAFGLAQAVGNGAFAFALLWILGASFRLLSRRDGLGFGDVKLAGASAIWLDLETFSISLQLAAFAALLLILLRSNSRSDPQSEIPFGAFLAPATWLTHFVSLAWPDVFARAMP